MKRINAVLEDRQMERLAYHNQRTGASQSELLRRALDAYLDRLDEEEFHLSQAEYRTNPPPTDNR